MTAKGTASVGSVDFMLDDSFINPPNEYRLIRDSASRKLLSLIRERPDIFAATTEYHNQKKWGITPHAYNASLTYRKLTNWVSEGLFTGLNEQQGEWREYSILDLIWLDCVNALRDFGFPVSKLRISRQWLTNHDFLSGSEYPALEFYLLRHLLYLEPCHLLVFEDGAAFPVSREELIDHFQETSFRNLHHIVLDLGILMTMNVLNKPKLKAITTVPDQSRYIRVATNELAMLYHLRADNTVKSVKAELDRRDPDHPIISLEVEQIRDRTENAERLRRERNVTHVEPIEERERLKGYRQRKNIKMPPKVGGRRGSKPHPE